MSAPPVFWPLLVGLRARTLALVGRARERVDALDQISAPMKGPANVLAPQFVVLRAICSHSSATRRHRGR